MTHQNLQTRHLDIHENTEQLVLLGGLGYVLGWFNLNLFRGRLTKLYINQGFNWNYETFAQMAELCSLPIQKEGQLFLTNYQLMNFDGTFLLQNSINQVGNNYYLSGWMKLDLSQQINTITFAIIRISAFKYFQDGRSDGDELFYMQVNSDAENEMITQIILQADMHKIPVKGEIGKHSKKITKYIVDKYPNQLYQGLMKWFFIQYEYGRKSSHKYGYYSIQLLNKPDLIQVDIGDSTYGGSLRNTKFYIIVGGDEYDFMIAQTFHLQFTYNYINDRDQIEISCHYSCLTCNGPLSNNCLSCVGNQNRFYQEDSKTCECQTGKLEDDSTKICIPLASFFTYIEKTETKYDQLFCQFGYFLLPSANNEFSCLQCPQQNNDKLLCVECYFYPLTWYKDPHCRYDLVSIRCKQSDALTLTQRDPNYYDQYVIDEFDVLLLKIGVQDICFNDCYQASFTHLKQSITINCKKNFVYENRECISSIDNCQLAYNKNICQYCVDGMEIKNNSCVPCGNHCILCNYLGLGVCLQCEEDYQLINNQCMRCGLNCKTCKLYDDFNIGKTYLKCFQCKEDSKYFISFDGINCLENTIQNCKYAFQSLKSNMKFNTLDQYFIPQFDQNQIETHCARCKKNYIYIKEQKVCLRGLYFDYCHFGYAEKIIDQDPNNSTQYLVTDEKYQYSTSKQSCLIAWHDAGNIQFSFHCQIWIYYCLKCLLKRSYYLYQFDCLACQSGYYADRQTGKCKPCLQALHCLQCFQEQTLSRDSWKQEIRAFYKQFIDIYDSHHFIEYGQSQNSEDYQVQCKLCQDGYELYQNNCIQSCPKSCAECQIINSKNVCVRCFKIEKGVQLSLSDNQCIDCPENCSLCRRRTQEEISSINPIFNTTYNELVKYSYQCLKPFQDQEYFYDSEIGYFIICQNPAQGCEKQYNINFNLYCSIDEFNKDLNSLNDYEQDQFLQHNLFINQLGSFFTFEQLNNYNFYKMASQESIKVLNICIASKKQQKCQILKESLFNQQFSQQIFSAINVILTIEGLGKTVFEFHQSIGFYNFSQITLSGLILESISNQINNEIIFDSLFRQKITLKNIEFKQNSKEIAMLKIHINQVRDLQIQDFIINGVNQNNNHSIVFISSTIYNKNLSFKNIQLIDSCFTNQSIFLIDVGSDDKILFNNFSISHCAFRNSNLIQLTSEQIKGSLRLQDFKFDTITLSKTLSFIDLSVLDFSQIQLFSFINSTIIDSSILLINQNSQIIDILIQQNNFQEINTIIIWNKIKIS